MYIYYLYPYIYMYPYIYRYVYIYGRENPFPRGVVRAEGGREPFRNGFRGGVVRPENCTSVFF